MEFSEKKFAHLPARESHHKEAPYPKSKKIEKNPTDVHIDIEDKDPLWLKDKGDHFYKRHDYMSAVNAYSKSIENDKTFLMSRLNRGTTFLRMRHFQACIDEMNDIFMLISNVASKEREEDLQYYEKMESRAYLKRAAAHAWCSQFDLAIEDYKQAMTYNKLGFFSEQEISVIQHDISMIEVRKKSQEIKLQGDIFFARNMLDDSLA